MWGTCAEPPFRDASRWAQRVALRPSTHRPQLRPTLRLSRRRSIVGTHASLAAQTRSSRPPSAAASAVRPSQRYLCPQSRATPETRSAPTASRGTAPRPVPRQRTLSCERYRRLRFGNAPASHTQPAASHTTSRRDTGTHVHLSQWHRNVDRSRVPQRQPAGGHPVEVVKVLAIAFIIFAVLGVLASAMGGYRSRHATAACITVIMHQIG